MSSERRRGERCTRRAGRTVAGHLRRPPRKRPPRAAADLLRAPSLPMGTVWASCWASSAGEMVSTALRAFTGSVPKVVERHGGVTVYAGGDDVLAMLPIPRALACAQALSDAYRSAFADAAANTAAKDGATLSAAAVFAHIRLPLNHVLVEAHRLLDDVAKDGNGRDSLAAAVLKPGGPYCQWATTWTRPGPGGAVRATDQLQATAAQARREHGGAGSLVGAHLPGAGDARSALRLGAVGGPVTGAASRAMSTFARFSVPRFTTAWM